MQVELAGSTRTDPYDLKTVHPRSPADLVVVKMLHTVLTLFRRGRDSEGDSILDKAKVLSPDYWEVHRVEAFINAARGNRDIARRCYEAAIQLEPKSAPLRYWCGGFLLRNNDPEAALEQFEHGLREDPGSVALRIEAARAHVFLRNWTRADTLLPEILKDPSLGEHQRRIAWDLYLQVARRRAECAYDRGEPIAAVRAYGESRDRWRKCPPQSIDKRMMRGLSKALKGMRACLADLEKLVASDDYAKEMREIVTWAEFECFGRATPDHSSQQLLRKVDSASAIQPKVGERYRGKVIRIDEKGAVLDLGGGIEGFLPRTRSLLYEYCPTQAKEIVEVGQETEVVCVNIKRNRHGKMKHVGVRLADEVADSPEQTRYNAWEKITEIHPVGSRARARVLGFVVFGAIVQLESGFTGLVHNKELSWTEKNAKALEILRLNDAIEVVVQHVDCENRKLYLSYREAMENPWLTFADCYPVGTITTGAVVGLQDYGAFVKLPNGCVGLLYKNEIAPKRAPIQVGETLSVEVLDFNAESRRISLRLSES